MLPFGARAGWQPPSLSRRALLRAAWALAGAGSLAACQPPRLPMRVGSLVFPGYEFIYLARELGLLDPRLIRLVDMRANTETVRALASGQLEAALLTVDEMLTARAEGVDLMVLAMLDASDGADAVVARPGVDLRGLRGKRIAVEDGAVGGVMLAALLDAAGLQSSDIQKVAIDLPSSLQAFEQGRADAVVSAEPWVSQMEQRGGVRIFDSVRIAGRIVDVLVARRSAMDTYGDALAQLVQGHFQALALFRTNPEKVVPLMAPRLRAAPDQVKAMFKGLNLPDARANLELLAAQGSFDAMTRDLQKFMTSSGLIRQTIPLADFVDTRFLPR